MSTASPLPRLRHPAQREHAAVRAADGDRAWPGRRRSTSRPSTARGSPRQPRQYFDGIDATGGARAARAARAGPRPPERASGLRGILRGGHDAERGLRARRSCGATWATSPACASSRRRRGAAPGGRLPGAALRPGLAADKVAQAVSLWTAIQTALARRGRGVHRGEREPVYRRARDRPSRPRLTEQEDRWGTLFAAHGIVPLTIVYEGLRRALGGDAAPCAALHRRARRGPDRAPRPPAAPSVHRALPGDWVERYVGTPALSRSTG